MSERRERGHGYVYKREKSSAWWCSFSIDGKKARMSTGVPVGEDEAESKKKALVWLRATIKEANAGRFVLESRSIRYEYARDQFFKDHRANNRKSIVITSHLDATFTGTKLAKITTARIRQFIADMQDEGLAAGTINRQLSYLRKMFSLALQDKSVERDSLHPAAERGATAAGLLHANRVLPFAL